MKRFLLALLVLLLLVAHIWYWYLPRERAATPDPAGAPYRLLASGGYDVCLWLPYPHQNLGQLGGQVEDLPEVLAAIERLAAKNDGGASIQDLRSFGPFTVPPAREVVACSDLAGGRWEVMARVYPFLAAVAKLAGRLADNPWLAGGDVGRLRVAWREGLWTVSSEAPAPGGAGGAAPSDSPVPASSAPGEQAAAAAAPSEGGTGGAPVMSSDLSPSPAAVRPRTEAAGAPFPAPPEGLALLRLGEAVPQLPPGTYVLRREGGDLVLVLLAAANAANPRGPGNQGDGARSSQLAGGAGQPGGSGGSAGSGRPGGAGGSSGSDAPPDLGPGPRPALLAVAGADWPAEADRPRPPAALVLFEGASGGGAGDDPPRETAPETAGEADAAARKRSPGRSTIEGAAGGASFVTTLPAAAAFNLPGATRWGLPERGIGKLLREALPHAEAAGWSIMAMDDSSLQQAIALAPRVSALVPPTVTSAGGLTLGVWLQPRATLRVVSGVRQLLQRVPLLADREVRHWRDWEAVLSPLSACDRVALTAASAPPSFHLRLVHCTSD